MLNFLYMIFIYPVYMFVEFIFFLANNITDDYIGFSIILLFLSKTKYVGVARTL